MMNTLWRSLIVASVATQMFATSFTFAAGGGPVWNGVSDSGLEAIWLDTTNDATPTVTWKVSNTDAIATPRVVSLYELSTGSWSWERDSISEYSFDGATKVWENADATEQWAYSRETKTWISAPDGSDVWTFNTVLGAWCYNPDGANIAWTFDHSAQQWTHVDSASVWSYDFYADAWVEESNPDSVVITQYPARPLVQHMKLFSSLHVFLRAGIMTTGGPADWSVAHDAGVWTATNGSSDEVAEHDSSAVTENVIYKSTHASLVKKKAVFADFTVATGAWSWTRDVDPLLTEMWAFNAGTSAWTDYQTGEVWAYDDAQKTWSSDGASWQQGALDLTWRHVDGDGKAWVWEFDVATGLWSVDDGTLVWSWRYLFNTNAWLQSSGNDPDAITYTFPPLVAAQKTAIDSAFYTLMARGAFVNSGPYGWTTVSEVDGVWSTSNVHADQTSTYNRSAQTVVWDAGDDKEVVTASTESGDWTWQSSFDVDDPLTYAFTARTGAWGHQDSTAEWFFDKNAQTWSDAAGTTWQRVSTVYTWKHVASDVTWTYAPDTGVWDNDDDANTYYYATESRAWVGLTTPLDDGADTSAFPPVPLVQQVTIATQFWHFARAGAFATGDFAGWTLTSSGDGVWTGVDSDGATTVVYDSTKPRYQYSVKHLGAVASEKQAMIFEYDIASSDIQLTHRVMPGVTSVRAFDHSAGTWSEDGVATSWVWDQDTTQWQHSGDGTIWANQDGAYTWSNSDTAAVWSFSRATGLWTDATNTRTWRFDLYSMQWTQQSGVAADAEDMPPLPLVSMMFAHGLFELGAVNGAYLQPHAEGKTMLPASDGVWQDENEELTFEPGASGMNRLRFTSGDDVLSWVFNPESGAWQWTADAEAGETVWAYEAGSWGVFGGDAQWTYADGVWTNSADDSLVWTLDPYAMRWTNEATGTQWLYQPAYDTWVNITTATAWSFDTYTQEWIQRGGAITITTDVPPAPLQQMMALSREWSGVLKSSLFAYGSLTNWGYTQMLDGSWVARNGSGDAAVTLSADPDDSLIALTLPVLPAWLASHVVYEASDGFTVTHSENPFFTDVAVFDGAAWQSDQAAGWTFDADTHVWSSDSAGYVWTFADGVWTNEDDSAQWSYDEAHDRWVNELGDSLWQYNVVTRTWSEVTDTGERPLMPYRPIIHDALVRHLTKLLVAGHTCAASADVQWNASTNDFRGTGTYRNGTAVYDPSEQTLQWSDQSGQTAVVGSISTHSWTWTHGETSETFDAATGAWTSADTAWTYTSALGVQTWQRNDDETVVWQSDDDGATWQHDDAVWTYSSSNGTWRDGARVYTFHFATRRWFADDGLSVAAADAPPLPLVEQQFMTALTDDLYAFIQDNPLYAAALVVPEKHALYGDRSLEKKAWYNRYNTSTIFMNDSLILDHVQLIHSDVSRNAGRLQLPSVTESALPAIIGGERASLNGGLFGPSIELYDSVVACHESLVSAGVRWSVHERVQGVAANTSSIICYQKGRPWDSLVRRGTVFQLGSNANRMADGSIDASIVVLPNGELSSSSLRDAFIDVYRSAPTVGATEESPTTIALRFDVAKEAGVGAKDNAQHILFLAHESRVACGWPTMTASADYTPWSIPLSYEGEGFSPGQTGKGQLLFSGINWAIAGRLSDNTGPYRPVRHPDKGAVVYVDYGGHVGVVDSSDITIDTAIVRRTARQEHLAGTMSVPSDQIVLGRNGLVQLYAVDFDNAAHIEGAHSGFVPGHTSSGVLAMDAADQKPDFRPMKSARKRSVRGPVRVRR